MLLNITTHSYQRSKPKMHQLAIISIAQQANP